MALLYNIDMPVDPPSGPLAGVRVIDASTILAGPLACQILGDFGADVVKIEHPDEGRRDARPRPGQGRRPAVVEGDLPQQADDRPEPVRARTGPRCSCGSPRPPTWSSRTSGRARWSGGASGPTELHEVNPGLVILRITGFGQTGPYAARAGFGTLAEAMSGFAHLTGQADGPPTLPAFGLADSIAGIAASSAVSMALLAREKDPAGRGQVVDLNLLEPIMTAVGPGPTVYQQTGEVGTRHGNRSTNNAPRNAYETSDGHWVAISTSAQSIAERVMHLVGHPEVIDEPWFAAGSTRAEHADELDAMVGGWIAERTRDEVLAAFDEAGAAVAPIYSARDLVEDPHVRGTGMLREVDDVDLGPMVQHDVMWRMSGDARLHPLHRARRTAQDTDEVLGELGLDADELADLRARGVIA